MMVILEKEFNVGVGGLPFNKSDAYNFLRITKTIRKVNDADKLVLICKRLKEKDNNFWYEYVVDDDNRLKHIALSHSASLYGYQHYGDVIVFDTTYKLNIYKMLNQLIETFQYASILTEHSIWLLKQHGTLEGGCTVIHIEGSELISCSCREFEFCGIICHHAIAFMLHTNYALRLVTTELIKKASISEDRFKVAIESINNTVIV
ncbi:hypothetical protein NE237_017308 [Protea cynaroides]|uniref:SWIM-type domain-containing protein n=1 Tax=Protea cynaroides TaxID=273540 RepID=A0A9Q0QN15_9MAGN|nr:hypothetical protein NE237_017308 [Protea cynaroides]